MSVCPLYGKEEIRGDSLLQHVLSSHTDYHRTPPGTPISDSMVTDVDSDSVSVCYWVFAIKL